MSFAVVGDDPLFMLTGPIPATRRILERSGLTIDDLDAYEVNEAFASVPLAWAHDLARRPRAAQPVGRRDRPRARARLVGHAAARHAAGHPRGHRRPLRSADDVRGRRHGERHDHRAPVVPARAASVPRALQFPASAPVRCGRAPARCERCQVPASAAVPVAAPASAPVPCERCVARRRARRKLQLTAPMAHVDTPRWPQSAGRRSASACLPGITRKGHAETPLVPNHTAPNECNVSACIPGEPPVTFTESRRARCRASPPPGSNQCRRRPPARARRVIASLTSAALVLAGSRRTSDAHRSAGRRRGAHVRPRRQPAERARLRRRLAARLHAVRARPDRHRRRLRRRVRGAGRHVRVQGRGRTTRGTSRTDSNGGGDDIPLTIAGPSTLRFVFDDNVKRVGVEAVLARAAGYTAADDALVAAPVRQPGSDEQFYFVMTDRFANGDPSNDLGGLDRRPPRDRLRPHRQGLLPGRRHRGPAREARLHRGTRHDGDLAHPELQEPPGAGRGRERERRLPRLLDHRLHADRPAPRHERGARGAHRRGARRRTSRSTSTSSRTTRPT